MPRASISGISLNEADARIIKGMIARGDRQHDIAAWFGVNGGRIGEVSSGENFSNVGVAQGCELPPPEPYLTGKSSHAAYFALTQAKEVIDTAISLIEESSLGQP